MIIDFIFPNFILTTVLDVDYDSHHRYYKHKREQKKGTGAGINHLERPVRPPFLEDSSASTSNSSSTSNNSALSIEFKAKRTQMTEAQRLSQSPETSASNQIEHHENRLRNIDQDDRTTASTRHRFPKKESTSTLVDSIRANKKLTSSPLSGLFDNEADSTPMAVDVFVEQSSRWPSDTTNAGGTMRHSSVIEIFEEDDAMNKGDNAPVAVTKNQHNETAKGNSEDGHHQQADSGRKNHNLKSTDHQPRLEQQQQRLQPSAIIESDRSSHNVRL